jgi:2-C-methyl-D-erythritol 2,4-cyclodiphosphate synthase
MRFRIGQGVDIHRLEPGRKLILGGVEVPWEKGLLGHSDADVVCHALSNALLGAIGEGDIGQHFPDSNPRYKGASSLALLRVVMEKVKARGYRVGRSHHSCTEAKARRL